MMRKMDFFMKLIQVRVIISFLDKLILKNNREIFQLKFLLLQAMI